MFLQIFFALFSVSFSLENFTDNRYEKVSKDFFGTYRAFPYDKQRVCVSLGLNIGTGGIQQLYLQNVFSLERSALYPVPLGYGHDIINCFYANGYSYIIYTNGTNFWANRGLCTKQMEIPIPITNLTVDAFHCEAPRILFDQYSQNIYLVIICDDGHMDIYKLLLPNIADGEIKEKYIGHVHIANYKIYDLLVVDNEIYLIIFSHLLRIADINNLNTRPEPLTFTNHIFKFPFLLYKTQVIAQNSILKNAI